MIDQLDGDDPAAVHDMRVGQHESVGADDESGALGPRGHVALAVGTGHAPEELREGIIALLTAVAAVAERIPTERVSFERLGVRDLRFAFADDADHGVMVLRNDGAVVRSSHERNRAGGYGAGRRDACGPFGRSGALQQCRRGRADDRADGDEPGGGPCEPPVMSQHSGVSFST